MRQARHLARNRIRHRRVRRNATPRRTRRRNGRGRHVLDEWLWMHR
jgi:hypothetical protein